MLTCDMCRREIPDGEVPYLTKWNRNHNWYRRGSFSTRALVCKQCAGTRDSYDRKKCEGCKRWMQVDTWYHFKHILCSEKCRRPRRKPTVEPCQMCGTEMVQLRDTKKFCSTRCRVAAYRRDERATAHLLRTLEAS